MTHVVFIGHQRLDTLYQAKTRCPSKRDISRGPHAIVDPDEVVSIPQVEAAEHASAGAFQSVFENGTKIELDYYVVYFAHFEFGRLHVWATRKALVFSSIFCCLVSLNVAGWKGKYSLENELQLGVYLDALDEELLALLTSISTHKPSSTTIKVEELNAPFKTHSPTSHSLNSSAHFV